ncbi:hypothetical protein IAT40_002703 [Kwoniella sp. CBS 6097]
MIPSAPQSSAQARPPPAGSSSSTNSGPPKRSHEEMQKIFQAFEDYKFTEDPVFNDGLPTVFQAIRGKKMSPGMIDKTIAEAQWFYWTKINNLPIPFSEYEKHITQPLIPPLELAGQPTRSDRGPNLSEAFRMMGLDGSAGQTHLTFENLQKLVVDGQADHLLGKEIPNRTSDLPPSKSSMEARPKPWRKQKAQAQAQAQSSQPIASSSTSASVASSSAPPQSQPQNQNQGQLPYQAQYQPQAQTSHMDSFSAQPPTHASISALFSHPPDLGLFTGADQFQGQSLPQSSAFPMPNHQSQSKGYGHGQASQPPFDPQYQPYFPLEQDLSPYMQIPVFPPELYPVTDAPGPTVTYSPTMGSGTTSSSTLLPEMPLSPSFYSPYSTDQVSQQSQSQSQQPGSSTGVSASSSEFDPAQAAILPSGRGGGQDTLGVDMSGQEGMELDEHWMNPAWFSQMPNTSTGGTGEETPRAGSRTGPATAKAPTAGVSSKPDQCPPQ